MHPIFQLYFVIFLCTAQRLSEIQEAFKEDADDIFQSVLGDENKVRKTNVDPKRYLEKLKKEIKRKMNIKKKLITTTTEKIQVATAQPGKYLEKITAKDINIRRINIKVAKLLHQNSNPVPNFNNDDDDFDIITERFDKIRQKAAQEEEDARKSYLRMEYFASESKDVVLAQKKRTLALMEHYIYETRYKLPYAQLMRKKYKGNIRYKIGYCFSLMRQLKQQQMILYSTLRYQYLNTTTLHFHLKMYEKIVRLDVDIKDVMLKLKRMEKKRKLAKNPHYYDTN